MLNLLSDFREILDRIMVKALHSRVALIGYESYTGRFITWYAKYYHNIEIDYLIDTHMSRGVGHTQVIYTPELLDIDYKDVKSVVVWMAEPVTEFWRDFLEERGYIESETYFDLYGAVYGDDIYWDANDDNIDVFRRRKTGLKDIQFLEWLEWKYGCNFVQRVPQEHMEVVGEHGSGYGVTTQREIFPILDACHCIPKADDAAFDFGCGKGGPIVAFLDYGFEHVGGVEYEPKIYSVLVDNIQRLGLNADNVEVINKDAALLEEELDSYNWFYFYEPFDSYIFESVLCHICESYRRKKRKIRIILINPDNYKMVENTGIFRLFIQPTIDTRRRVVNVYETYE